jgi:hypothetical protein
MTDRPWPADKPERRSLSSLKPFKRNARTHAKEQIRRIAESIQEWGFTIPILIDEESGIIAGHARAEAAKILGLEEVPVIVASGWTEAQKRAYVLADNQLHITNSGWDGGLLKDELIALEGLDFDLSKIGFSVPELAQYMAAETFGDPEAEWAGMPDYHQEDKLAFKSLIVNFKSQDAVNAFASLVQQRITEKTRSIWFPLEEKQRVADLRWSEDESAISDLHSVEG